MSNSPVYDPPLGSRGFDCRTCSGHLSLPFDPPTVCYFHRKSWLVLSVLPLALKLWCGVMALSRVQVKPQGFSTQRISDNVLSLSGITWHMQCLHQKSYSQKEVMWRLEQREIVRHTSLAAKLIISCEISTPV